MEMFSIIIVGIDRQIDKELWQKCIQFPLCSLFFYYLQALKNFKAQKTLVDSLQHQVVCLCFYLFIWTLVTLDSGFRRGVCWVKRMQNMMSCSLGFINCKYFSSWTANALLHHLAGKTTKPLAWYSPATDMFYGFRCINKENGEHCCKKVLSLHLFLYIFQEKWEKVGAIH